MEKIEDLSSLKITKIKSPKKKKKKDHPIFKSLKTELKAKKIKIHIQKNDY